MSRKSDRRKVNKFTYERMQKQQVKYKKRKLYLVVGASGSGKDYIVDKCCHKFNKSKVISRTTRRPRFLGESTHKFVTWEQSIEEFWDAIAKTTFNGNRYYVLEQDLHHKDFYIIDPAGVHSMNKSALQDICYEVIFLDVSWKKRMKQMRKRGDSWFDIISRLLHDSKAFKKFKEYDKKFANTNDFYEYILKETKKSTI